MLIGYRISFTLAIAPSDIRNLHHMACMSLAALHGDTCVEMACRHSVSDDGRTYRIEADNGLSRDLATIFVGTARRILGKDCCEITLLEEPDDANE